MGNRKKGLMSDEMKYELAKELGIDNLVHDGYWGDVPSKQCGNLVRKAIEIAEKNLAINGSLNIK